LWYCARFRPDWTESGRNDRIPGNLAEILMDSTILAVSPAIWSDSSVLAESQDDWPGFGQDGRIPVNWLESGYISLESGINDQIPATFAGIRMRQIFKKKIFLLLFFML
jgi:hypothetical protein